MCSLCDAGSGVLPTGGLAPAGYIDVDVSAPASASVPGGIFGAADSVEFLATFLALEQWGSGFLGGLGRFHRLSPWASFLTWPRSGRGLKIEQSLEFFCRDSDLGQSDG